MNKIKIGNGISQSVNFLINEIVKQQEKHDTNEV